MEYPPTKEGGDPLASSTASTIRPTPQQTYASPAPNAVLSPVPGSPSTFVEAPSSPVPGPSSPNPEAHPNDVLCDPDHRLRLCRTATETIHEAISEDDRRRAAKKRRKHGKRASTLRRRFTLGAGHGEGRKRGDTVASTTSSAGHGDSSVPASPAKRTLPRSISASLARAASLTARHRHHPHQQPSTVLEVPEERYGIDEHTENLAELEDSPAADMHRGRASHKHRSRIFPFAKASHAEAKRDAGDGSKGGWFGRLFGKPAHPKAATTGGEGTENGGRTVYVNVELPSSEHDVKGRHKRPGYPRNKVRTTKYTILTFVPKNLTEQFHNVANVYFLALVVLQVFPIFGAAAPQIAMLPLVFILSLTAVKDAFEDYRRYVIDSGVNNSPCTRLGDWRNVNEDEGRKKGWAEWWDGVKWGIEDAVPGQRTVHERKGRKVSKGVKKLREKEKDMFDARFLRSQYARKRSGTATRPSTATTTAERLSDIGDVTPRFDADLSLPGEDQLAGGIVDYGRRVPGTATWERTLWKKLVVGDLVLLREDELVPADLLVLATSDPLGGGQCFVETKNLDGETNLKPRRAVKATQASGIRAEEDLERARFVVESERQGANLYSYKGTLRYWAEGEEEKRESVGINELLLRGCTLRNTEWVLGLVMFTGRDTKIMLNQGAFSSPLRSKDADGDAGDTPSKRPRIARETNFNVLANFAILVGLCASCAIGDGVLQHSTRSSAWDFERGVTVDDSAPLDALVVFGAALIVFQSIVPISLVITLELVRTIQAFFILQDVDMYYEPLDHPCVPKSWNLSDDLGQIAYVFSDKTGTLTQNVMEFQRCSVGGKAYGEGVTEAMKGSLKKRQGALDALPDEDTLKRLKADMIGRMERAFGNRYLDEDSLTLIAPDMVADLRGKTDQADQLVAFWRSLALCHDVLASADAHDPYAIEYKAESPDEAALVSAARDVGFVFVSKAPGQVELDVMGRTERYTPLRILEFNSSRKRMSVVVRCPDGRVKLFCKGADSILMARLKPDHDPDLKDATQRDLEKFANSGLRTLVVAERDLTDAQLAKFLSAHDKAMLKGQTREEEMERVADGVERDLTLLGATALEDKLQEGVPEAIAQLHEAGLKLWILTGDKLQTAIEIGFSCNLLTNDMDIIILSSDGEDGARSQIEQALEKLLKAHPTSDADDEKRGPKGGYAVVIDGDTLRYALDASLKKQFLALTIQCETVVCCRVSPAQKALTVKLVKDGCRAMTLAIGDGANDVAMIQEANIGVGIAGLEGAQASMSADYAIGQFRYLSKLLLVHGRWCYLRIADMHTGFFFKNGVFTFTLFWYQIYCSWNGSYLFDYTLIMLFNLVFTSLPVAMLGIFEQDLGATPSMLFPALYQVGITGSLYTRVTFFVAMLDSVYQSCVCFWIPYFAYFGIPTASVTGHDVSVWEFGSCVAVAAVLVANNFVALQTRFFTWIIAVILVLSSVTVFVWIAIYSQFQTFTFDHVAGYLFSTLTFWASILVVQILALLPRFAFHFAQLQYRPTVADSIREYVLSRPKEALAALEEARSDFSEEPKFSRRPSLKEDHAESHEMATVVAGLPTISIHGSTDQEAPGLYAPSSSPERPPRIRTESATSQDALARHTDSPDPPLASPTSEDALRSDRPTSYDSAASGVTPSPSWATALDDTPEASRVL